MMLGSKRRLFTRIALCAALVSSALVTASTAALADCETVWIEVYTVDLDARQKSYEVGDTALLDVTVTREDTGTPVEDATVVAFVENSKRGFIVGWVPTDAAGHATVPLKLTKKNVRLGPAKIRSVGFKDSVNATCASLTEFGKKRLRNAFVVKP
jgi:hypothetical protein